MKKKGLALKQERRMIQGNRNRWLPPRRSPKKEE